MSSGEPSKLTVVLTRPALERLIGGDSELEVKLRHAAVKHVVEKHFQTLLNTSVVESVSRTVTKAVNDRVSEEVGKICDHYPYRLILNSKIEVAIRTYAESYLRARITQIIGEVVNAIDIETLVKYHIGNAVAEKIQNAVKERLDQISREISGG